VTQWDPAIRRDLAMVSVLYAEERSRKTYAFEKEGFLFGRDEVSDVVH